MTTDPQLTEILAALKDVPDVYRPSPFWEELAAAGVSQHLFSVNPNLNFCCVKKHVII